MKAGNKMRFISAILLGRTTPLPEIIPKVNRGFGECLAQIFRGYYRPFVHWPVVRAHGTAMAARPQSELSAPPATSNLILRPLARFIAGLKGHPGESVNARGKNDGFL